MKVITYLIFMKVITYLTVKSARHKYFSHVLRLLGKIEWCCGHSNLVSLMHGHGFMYLVPKFLLKCAEVEESLVFTRP